MAREAWTDERLDDLKASVDGGFKEMHEEFRAIREEIGSESRAIREEIGSESRGIRAEISTLNRSVHQLTWGLIGAMLVGFLGTTSAIVTQL